MLVITQIHIELLACFRPSIANNDWCYIRQVGSDNAFKLAFDFHDDGNDAGFCIRNVQSINNPDTIS